MQQWKWELFAKQPQPALIPVVKEFYTNAGEYRDIQVFVKSKWFPFDSTSINRLYNLSDVDDDEYSKL